MRKDGILKNIEDIDALVPDVPDRTHVIEVDNFGNVKLFTSKADAHMLAHAKQVDFGFGKESIEYDANLNNIRTAFNAEVRPTLFQVSLDTNVICLKSSSRLLGGKPVPMLATMRERPGEKPPIYKIPKVGQPVKLIMRS